MSLTAAIALCLIYLTLVATLAEAFSGANHRHASIITRFCDSGIIVSSNTGLFQAVESRGSRVASMESMDVNKCESVTSIVSHVDDIEMGSAPTNGSASTKATTTQVSSESNEENVPSTWSAALRRFFVGDIGPPMVVLAISGFVVARLRLPVPFSIAELALFSCAIVFWWVQEYVLHRFLLHSLFDWLGKSIHHNHHTKNYFHVSIDPPELILGWLFAAHFFMRWTLPYHLCLIATVGYALAGLGYEWSHYIVHTKVKPPSQLADAASSPVSSSAILSALSGLFLKMRDNHIRHHRIDDRYWYAFSVPAMDDYFYTNPNISGRVSKQQKGEQSSSS